MLVHTTFAVATTSAVADPDVRALVSESQPGAVIFFPVDASIYAQGDEIGPLYLVEFGTVRICQLTPDGRRQITSFCFAGDVFGLEHGDEHEFYAESVDGAGVRVLRPSNVPGFAAKLLRLALRSFARLQAHVVVIGQMSANERMARFLTDLLERQDSDGMIHLPMQRNDIADYLGMTFETVSRVLRVLRDRDLISVPSVDSIEVLDSQALADFA